MAFLQDLLTNRPKGKDLLNMLLQIAQGPPKKLDSPLASPGFTGQPTTTPTATPTPTAMPTATPTPTRAPIQPDPYFGMGEEPAYIQPNLYDALVAAQASDEERRNIAELSGQESSYGYAGPHIDDVEESYGPFHVNLLAGRINPLTDQPFTREEAESVVDIVNYALDEYRRTGGLGMWNPGAYDFYQTGIPERATRKKFMRGQ